MTASFPGSQQAILTVAQCYAADAYAAARGISGAELMERAGEAVADAVCDAFDPCDVIVLCGPGNNGGDGFVAARHLKARGWKVRLALSCDKDALKGDAAHHAGLWDGGIEPFSPQVLNGAELVIDAIFGAGLGRDVGGIERTVLEAAAGLPVVAVDVPSGIDGDTGAVRGYAPEAVLTVTFFRGKPAHVLMPGCHHCGDVLVADIGIPEAALAEVTADRPSIRMNDPSLWLDRFPWATPFHHKYSRGYAVIAGGTEMTGAARLAARAAQRIGAGIVTIATSKQIAPVYRVDIPSIVVKAFNDTKGFTEIISDSRIGAGLIGPGMGQDGHWLEKILAFLRTGKPVVLDADALSLFEGNHVLLFDAIAHSLADGAEGILLTPHEGEFAKLFPAIEGASKIDRVLNASRECGATILLKGYDTVIASPDGRVVVNANAPADLATAGSGDVLSGLCVGLIAQGVEVFEAAAMATWVHGDAAGGFGPGLIAEDIVDNIPATLNILSGDR